MPADDVVSIEFESIAIEGPRPDPRGHTVGSGRRWPRPSWLVAGALVVALAATAAAALRIRTDRNDVQTLLRYTQAQRADSDRKLAAMSTPPAPIQAGAGGSFVLPGAGDSPAGSIAVLITTDRSGPVWFMVDVAAAIPGQPFGLLGGRCVGDRAVAEGFDWANGTSNPRGRVHFLANQLALDPADPDLWVRVHSGTQDIGGVRGPFAHPVAVEPGANPCG